MLLFILAYLAGALTIVSPCILPVLPFVFARAGQPFLKSGLPLLAGMGLTFAVVGTLAAIGGGWAVAANQYGRAAALVVLAVFGLTLLLPALADRLTRPLVALGARLSESAAAQAGRGGGIAPSFMLGIATGLLWAPCAGPVLGLILTGAALEGASVRTTLLLLAYAAGAATSLALALVIGGRVFQMMKRSIGIGEWVRRGLGALVLAGVAMIALGLDTGLLTRLSSVSTAQIEQGLLDRIGRPSAEAAQNGLAGTGDLPVLGMMPSLAGATGWINSAPLTTESLRGKVVLVDFWTYSCINCLRTIPYIRAWAEKYRDQGLVVIGVHSPEFAFEKVPANVKDAVQRLGLTYPVAMDNDFAIWRAFQNKFWPAHYFIDASGRIRHVHFGEGDYAESERIIQQLLKDAGVATVDTGIVKVAAAGAEIAPDNTDDLSPETYVGLARATHFVSPGGALANAAKTYEAAPLQLNDWDLTGNWVVGEQRADLQSAGGTLSYRFHARDLHLVLGTGDGGKPVRFRVSIDGQPPGVNAGVDVDASGVGEVKDQRLYQLIRQKGQITDRTFEIEFLDPGAQVFAFTFG